MSSGIVARALRAAGVTLVTVALALAFAGGAWAQGLSGYGVLAPKESAAPPPPADEAKELEGVVSTLEDPAARDELITQLKALIAAARTEGAEAPSPEITDFDALGIDFVAELGERADTFATSMTELTWAIVDLPDLRAWALEQAADPEARTYWYEVIGTIAAALLLGALAHQIVRRLLASSRRRLSEVPEGAGLAERGRRMVARTLLDTLPLIAFAIASHGTLRLLGPEDATQLVASALINATLATASVLLLARAALAPRTPSLRLFSVDDGRASYFYRWIKRFSHVIIYGYFFFHNDALLRIPEHISEGLERALGFVVTLMVVVLIFQNREPVAAWLRGADPAAERHLTSAIFAVRRFLAAIWHYGAAAYVAGTYFIWALKIPGGFELLFRGAVATTILLGMARPLAQMAERLIGRGIAVDEVEGRYPALRARANRYFGFLHRFAVGIVYLLVALTICRVWGLDLIGWLRTSLGGAMSEQVADIGLVLLLAVAVWEVSGILVESYLGARDDTGAPVERSGRIRTLLPLLRTALLVVIALVILLHAMSALGLDLAPLLATAGVIGIAIGFGSQKLVQDVINGLFILFQDTISVGDFVEVAGHEGTVERISVRTIELRDLSGVVHTIPFSEIATVKNWAKDYGYAMLDIGVAYREDVDDVIEVLRQVGAELEADPQYGQFMLEPIDVMGLDSFADSAVMLRARIKTKTLKQWFVKREFNLRLKRRFDELGIEIPFPQQTVYFGQDKAGRASPVNVRMAREPEPASLAAESEGLRVVEPTRARTRERERP